jgi:hypothetical protein
VSKEYSFFISHPGEQAAGLLPYTEDISVIVGSASPEDEDLEFVEHMQGAMQEWYEGAKISLQRRRPILYWSI